MTPSDDQTDILMTTAEVAQLLRVKERKIYDLVSEEAIPHTKVTGKLLFPRGLIDAWIRSGTSVGGTSGSTKQRPPIAAGSHDPLLEWALNECGCGISPLFEGSLDGFARFCRGDGLFAGIHVPGPRVAGADAAGLSAYNHHLRIEAEQSEQRMVLIAWAVRRQGLILSPGVIVQGGKDLSLQDIVDQGLTVKARQESAGSRILLRQLLEQSGVPEEDIQWCAEPARTETEAALSLLDGGAQAAFGIEAVARRFNLAFSPLASERYDLLMTESDYFGDSVQALMAFSRTDAFAEKAVALGGYDISDVGLAR